MTLIIVFLVVLVLTLAVSIGVLYAKHHKLRLRFSPILDVEAEAAKAQAELEKLKSNIAKEAEEVKNRKEELSRQYSQAKNIFDQLQKEVVLLEENIEDISFGLYKPHYNFDSSEIYRLELQKIYEKQKALIKNEQAAVCKTQWTVSNSKQAGARMTKQYLKLILRAFNGECEAAVAKVTWNNVARMQERISKTFETINKLGQVMQMSITVEYLEIKLAELRLTYEEEQKKHEEIEEQRRLKEQMREEEKALREAEKAKKEAEEEEQRYEKALEKAREEMANAKGEEMDKMNTKIRELEEQLAEAHLQKDRATSLAEITRSGHVYILSNIGSFGENVFKIGMTRRYDPMLRVKELGDASVPFGFDIHAMIYSKDAPSLEAELHKQFEDRRVNLVNPRKEFFNVNLQEIEDFGNKINFELKLTMLAEAREYRETLAMKTKTSQGVEIEQPKTMEFPEQI